MTHPKAIQSHCQNIPSGTMAATFSEFILPSVIRESHFESTLTIFHAAEQFTIYANRTIIKANSL